MIVIGIFTLYLDDTRLTKSENKLSWFDVALECWISNAKLFTAISLLPIEIVANVDLFVIVKIIQK